MIDFTEKLKKLIENEGLSASKFAEKILHDFEKELGYFKQVCPIEMLDKLDNPITLKPVIKKVS